MTPSRFALAGGVVVAGERLEVLEDGYVLVDGGRIAAVGVHFDLADCSTFNLSGHLLIPGLINSHTHLGDSALKEIGFGTDGWKLVMPPDGLRHRLMAELPPATVGSAMRATMRQMLRTGTVAFADFREQGRPGVEALLEAARGLPIRPVVFGRHARPPRHTEEDLKANRGGLSPDEIAEIESILEVADGFSFVSANDTTDQGLSDAAAVVRRMGGRLAVHAAETDRYRDISVGRTGRGDIERLLECLRPDFLVHLTAATEQELELVAEAGIPAVFCARMQSVLGNGLPPFLRALDHGLSVGLGTDNVMLTSPNLLRELDYVSRASRALARDPSRPSPRELLSAVTTTAARMLGLDRDLGAIEPEREATMLVIDMATDNLAPVSDPLATLVNRTEANDIRAVVVAGKLVVGSIEGLEAAEPDRVPREILADRGDGKR